MTPILHQPDVHYSQIASFLPFKDLALCLRLCKGLQEKIVLFLNEPRSVKRLVHPITERFLREDLDSRLCTLLVTARKVREKVGFGVSAINGTLLVPEDVLREAHIVQLKLECGGELIDLHYIQCAPRLQEISLDTLTPPVAAALASNCPDLRKVSVTQDTAYNESLRILACCPNLTDLVIYRTHESGDSNLTQLRHLRSLNAWDLSPETLRNLTPTITDITIFTDITILRQKEDELVSFFSGRPQLRKYKGCVSDAILAVLSPELETLEVLSIAIPHRDALALFMASHPSLTHLDLHPYIRYPRDVALGIFHATHLKLRKLVLPSILPRLPEMELRLLVIRCFPSLTYLQDSRNLTVESPPGQTIAQLWGQS
jgi:hypothetical protein